MLINTSLFVVCTSAYIIVAGSCGVWREICMVFLQDFLKGWYPLGLIWYFFHFKVYPFKCEIMPLVWKMMFQNLMLTKNTILRMWKKRFVFSTTKTLIFICTLSCLIRKFNCENTENKGLAAWNNHRWSSWLVYQQKMIQKFAIIQKCSSFCSIHVNPLLSPLGCLSISSKVWRGIDWKLAVMLLSNDHKVVSVIHTELECCVYEVSQLFIWLWKIRAFNFSRKGGLIKD